LLDETFLTSVAKSYLVGQFSDVSATPDTQAISQQLELLNAKRERILDAYFDGAISRQDRDQRIAKVDAEISTFKQLAGNGGAVPMEAPKLTMTELLSILSVFTEFPLLLREEKRSVLRSLGVKISVSAYTIKTLALRTRTRAGSYTDSPPKTVTSAFLGLPCL
jgi:hypothetical protein